MLGIGALLPAATAIARYVGANPSTEIDLIRVSGVDGSTMDVVIHAGHYGKGLATVCGFQQSTLLNADIDRVGVSGVEADMFGMRYMRRPRKRPRRHIDRTQGRQLVPIAADIIAEEKMRRLSTGVDAAAAVGPCGSHAVDILRGKTVAALFPGRPAILADMNGAFSGASDNRPADRINN